MAKLKTYTVTLVDKIWKSGGKRHHRTFTVSATSELEAKKKAITKLKGVANWKPSGAEARIKR